jgi:hypothetical protein
MHRLGMGIEDKKVGTYFGLRMPRAGYILTVYFEHNRRLSGAMKRVIETTIANAQIPSNGLPSHPRVWARITPNRDKIQTNKEEIT